MSESCHKRKHAMKKNGCWMLRKMVLLFVGLTVLVSSAVAQPPTEIPPSWLRDVELNDVYFLNEQLGWVVGEHGTILKTTDGGESWKNTANLKQLVDEELELTTELRRVMRGLRDNVGERAAPISRAVPTGINFRFESVHFADALSGLVVGGYDIPYLERSRAVVMKTTDGGDSWQLIKGLVIPKLTRVRFDDPFNAWAVGDGGNLFRTGIYKSQDGGKSWSSDESLERASFKDAQRTSNMSVVAINQHGKLTTLNGGKIKLAKVDGVREAPYLPPFHHILMEDPTVGWAVGAEGQIVRTTDGGQRWNTYLPNELNFETQVDYLARCLANGKLWIAGNPGTYFVSIDIKTGEVARHRVPISLPINSICFSSPTRGWAVGAGATVLTTVDGGNSWQIQKNGTRRIALLAVGFGEDDLPADSLAQYASEANLICAAAKVNFGSIELSDSRYRQATSRLGCNFFQSLFVDPDRPVDAAIKKLTQVIRTLQPTAVICESSPFRLPNGEFVDPQQLLKRAIEAAADRQVYSGQLVDGGLTPWQVDRLAVYDMTGTGELKLNNERFLPLTGRSVVDHAAISKALTDQPFGRTFEQSFNVTQFGISRNFNGSDLFVGLAQYGRQIPSRNEANVKRGNLQAMQQNLSKRTEIKELATWESTTRHSLNVWRQKLNQIVLGNETQLAGVWLSYLANEYMNSGRWELAAITLNQLVSRYPDHPLVPSAMVWLAQYHASDEMLANRIYEADEEPQAVDPLEVELQEIDKLLIDDKVKQVDFQAEPMVFESGGMNHMVWIPNQVKKEVDQEVYGEAGAPPKTDARTDSMQQASSIVTRIRARDPDLARDSRIRFLEAKLTERFQSSLAAESMYRQILKWTDVNQPVFHAASRELQLGTVNTESEIESSVPCVSITQRPNLDGILDDACWSQAFESSAGNLLQMTPPQGSSRTDVVVIGFDEAFFYIAARCNKLEGYPYRQVDSPRERDADMINRDRIEFTFDTDRDYQTFLQFAVDHRGWCRDGANGSAGWDPEWFVAQAEDDKAWTIEVAIPIRQLTATPASSESIWGISLARRSGRNSANLWPGKAIDMYSQEVGLHRVKDLNIDFRVLAFE